MEVAAIDVGYGWTKGRKGDLLFREPSIIGDSKQLYDQNKKDGYLIFENYFVGKLALKHSDIKYYCLKDSKANTWTTKVLLETSLAYLKANNSNIVTGLPVDFYFSQRGGFESLLASIDGNNVRLEIIGEGVYQESLNINAVKIVPQPLGAAMDFLLDDNCQVKDRDMAKGKILVIDWGRYTLDILILDGMEIHKASYSPHDLGIDVAYKLLSRLLREKIGKYPAAYELDSVVREGIYEGYDISPLVDLAFKSVIQQIQLEIEGLNMHFDHYLLAGGQSKRLNRFLDLPNMVIGNQLSNVDGYEKIGKRLWLGV